jgi:hypothetical protein
MRSASLALALLPALLVANAGCPSTPRCPAGFIGEAGAAPEAQMVFTDGISPTLRPATDGTVIPLELPPQGGYVMYVGARVRNLDACVEIAGSLRDPVSGNEVGFDARSTTLARAADGWAEPDGRNLANLSNVNGCPAYGPRDVHATPYDLVVRVTDSSGRVATVTHRVTPTCMQPDAAQRAECVCTCSANYTLGRCGGPFDAGL